MTFSRCPGRIAATVLLAVALLGACGRELSLMPPTIEIAGIVVGADADSSTVRYTLIDGRAWTANTDVYRLLSSSWAGDLLVAGADAEGRFLATFMRQKGLPADCYVENTTGVEWGDYIEIRGVLWSKAPGFHAGGGVPPRGREYPGGTRFCFGQDGFIFSTVAP